MAELLILVPTPFELGLFSAKFKESILKAGAVIELCGFGPIVSGIQTSRWISRHAPKQVYLLGIAGSYVPDLRPASVVEFGEVICYGVGAGSGKDYVSSGQMGWFHWADEYELGGVTVGDVIQIDDKSTDQLLTCSAASGNADDVRLRLEKYPRAIAEDMEGFSVAAACKLHRTPIRIFRGISNMAGDRNHERWHTREAIELLERKMIEVFAQ